MNNQDQTDKTQVQQDLEILAERKLNRRKMLGWMGAAGATTLLGAGYVAAQPGMGGFGGGRPPGGPGGPGGRPGGGPDGMMGQSTPIITAEGADGQCMNFSQETNGPYPADGTNGSRNGVLNALTESGIVRRNLLTDLDNPNQIAQGVQLDLELKLVDVNNACQPMAGYAMYLWACDAAGEYSLYTLKDRTYLRGVQTSDENGVVRFTTLFPGCYEGRYPHLHFEIFSSLENATSGKHALLISQLAMPKAECSTVYETEHYTASTRTFPRNNNQETDNVFGDNGSERIPVMTLTGEGSPQRGYRMGATIGIAT